MVDFFIWVVNTRMVSNFLVMLFAFYGAVMMIYSMLYIMYDKGRGTMMAPLVAIAYGLMGGIPVLFIALFSLYFSTEFLHMPLLS